MKKIIAVLFFLSSLGAFVTGTIYSSQVKKEAQVVKKHIEQKQSIAIYSGLGGAVAAPILLYGVYHMATRKKRKLRKLEIEKKKLEIIELRKKLEKEKI